MAHPGRQRVVLSALAGSLAGALEWAAGLWSPHPLDPVTGWESAVVITAMGAFFGICRLGLGSHGVWLAVGLWTALCVPEMCLTHGIAGEVGLLAVPVAVGLTAWRESAGLCLAVGVSLLVPAVRIHPEVPVEPLADEGGLLVVTVDTVRLDDGLLDAAGVVPEAGFVVPDGVVAGGPWTPPSMATLWLGQPVREHGAGHEVQGRTTGPVGGWNNAWTAVLAEKGASVEAVISNPHLRPELGWCTGCRAVWHADDAREPHLLVHTVSLWAARRLGGDTRVGRQRDARVVDWAVARLRSETGPDVLWVHLLEPHEYRRRPGDPRSAHRLGVAQTAARLRTLIEAAADRDIVVVADHGESMGEDGRWGHGRALVAETLLVPGAVRIAGVAGARVPGLWDAASLGRSLAVGGSLPTPIDGPVSVAGVRGAPDRLGEVDEAGRVSSVDGDSKVGPVTPAPGPRTRAALEALGYLDPPTAEEAP